jgi:hypothetical protein
MTRLIGAKRLERKLKVSIPKAVRAEVRKALAKQATRIVAAMKVLAPEWLRDSIDWTFGNPPSGAVVLADFGGAESDMGVTIYTTDWRARWFEFGTAERVQRSTGRRVGRITAQPFFYPAFRLFRQPARSAIARAVRKGIKEGAR